MNNIVEVQGLTKRFPGGFCLDGVDMALPYGAIMGFVGENGAGKTTTLGCILGTLKRDAGDIRLFGRAMDDGDTDLREDIGVVFDASNFSGLLTPEKLGRVMAGIYTRWDHALYSRYLTQFALPRDKRIATFSRGMTMKLSLAVALAHHPKLLILDEATGGLDPVVRDDMLDVFLDFVGEEDHAILMSSHVTSDLEKVCDYITFIHEGRIILSAPKDELLYRYAVARCKQSQFESLDPADMLVYRRRDYQVDVLVPDRESFARKYPDIVIDRVSIDDMMLMLIKGEQA